MNYFKNIEITRVNMSPSDDSTYGSGPSRKATVSLATLKLFELLLIITCLGLIDEPATHSFQRVFITPRTIGLCYVTFGALLIYTAIYLIMMVLGDLSPWKSSAFWSLVGFVMFLATSILLFRDWSNAKELNYWHPNMHRLDLVCASAAMCLISSLFYIFDLMLTIRFGSNGDLD